MTAEAMAPNGSTWYAWGHHWEVTSQTTKDGEEAVHAKCLSCDRNAAFKHPSVITRFLVRYGERKENDASVSSN